MRRGQQTQLFASARLVLAFGLIVFLEFANSASAQQSAGDWAWMGGDNSEPSWVSPTYGTKYQFAPQNWPGSREESATWTDANGRFWLFGGPGGTLSLLNDLWVFDRAQGAHGEWAWMGGSPGTCNFGCSGVYGTEYQFADTNIPGSRSGEAAWVDNSGRLWLFGGSGYDAAGTSGDLNDLWVFDPARGAHGQWAWMAGSRTVTCPANTFYCVGSPVRGTEYQFAPGNTPGGRESALSWADSNGKFWLFSGAVANGQLTPQGDLWVFDPALGAHGEWAWMGGTIGGAASRLPVYGTEYQFAVANSPSPRFSAAAWADESGRLWLFGGAGRDSAGNKAKLNDLWVFDPAQGDHGEWAWMGGPNVVADWNPNENTWIQPSVFGTEYKFDPANMPGGRTAAQAWTDATGRFWLYGGFGVDVNGAGTLDSHVNELWVFDPKQGTHGEWAWMGGNTTYLVCNYCAYEDRPPVSGPEYEFAAANIPGGRALGLTWVGSDGNLWLFGGQNYGFPSDFWEFRFFKPQTITFNSLPSSLVYGAAPITLSATATSGLPVTFKLVSGPGKLSGTNNSTLTITGGGAAVIVTANQVGDSEFSAAPAVQEGKWVAKAPLVVAADNQVITYGQTIPALTWTPTGFVNGDTAAMALTGSPALATTATSTSAPGTYPIQISLGTLASAKYALGFKPGALTIKPLGSVYKPTFTLPTGTYVGSRKIAINDATTGATIYYTTDGSTPSPSHGTQYTTVLNISTSVTLKAIAVKAGYMPSAVASATYTIQ